MANTIEFIGDFLYLKEAFELDSEHDLSKIADVFIRINDIHRILHKKYHRSSKFGHAEYVKLIIKNYKYTTTSNTSRDPYNHSRNYEYIYIIMDPKEFRQKLKDYYDNNNQTVELRKIITELQSMNQRLNEFGIAVEFAPGSKVSDDAKGHFESDKQ